MGEYFTQSKTLTFQTKKRLEFITITNEIKDFISESKIKEGSIVIQTHHTTCGVWINENEKNLVGNNEIEESDMKRILDRFANPNEEYGHNDIADVRNPNGKRDTHLCEPDLKGICHECINGHAHAQGMIIQSSLVIIVTNNKPLLGNWQEVMLVELDHDRKRKVTFMIQGTK